MPLTKLYLTVRSRGTFVARFIERFNDQAITYCANGKSYVETRSWQGPRPSRTQEKRMARKAYGLLEGNLNPRGKSRVEVEEELDNPSQTNPSII